MKHIWLCVICVVVLIIVLSGCTNTQEYSNDLLSFPKESVESVVQKSELIGSISDEITLATENEPDTSVNSIEITVNGKVFTATLFDNETAKYFARLLPLTLDMSELHGNEKYYYLDNDLPSNPTEIKKIFAGDFMLYGSECIVLFYENLDTTYSYTQIGKIDNPTELADVLGNGKITVTFQMK